MGWIRCVLRHEPNRNAFSCSLGAFNVFGMLSVCSFIVFRDSILTTILILLKK